MTPPAELVLHLTENGTFEALYGEKARKSQDWQIRAFTNLFPAFSSSPHVVNESGKVLFPYGYHMISVDTPSHNRDIDSFTDLELSAYIEGLRLVKDMCERDNKIKYVSIFKNQGKEAGASIPHSHTQIIGSERIPPVIARELALTEKIENEEGQRAMSKLIKESEEEQRIILSQGNFTVLTPFAPISPYEFWIVPTRKEVDWEERSSGFGRVLKLMISSMKKLLGLVPYNFYLHLSPRGVTEFWWHLECIPRVNTYAGYELGFGTYIITLSPEESAKLYKEQIPVTE